MTTLVLAAILIQALEGCRMVAYPDSGGVWTIGFGHTKNVKRGDTCTRGQAFDWLREDMASLLELVEGKSTLVGAALVSFGYNCGEGALRRFLAGEITLGDGGFKVRDDPYGEMVRGSRVLRPRRQLEAALIELGGGI